MPVSVDLFILWKCVITSIHRQNRSCLVFTVLWTYLAVCVVRWGDVAGVMWLLTTDGQCVSSIDRCNPVRRGGAGLYMASQPTVIRLAGDSTKAPSYSAAAYGEVSNHWFYCFSRN